MADTLRRLVPADWLASVREPLNVVITPGRAHYNFATRTMMVPPSTNPWGQTTVVHEWLHHAQEAWRPLQEACVVEHARRVGNEPQTALNTAPGEIGRRDKYYHPYMGREYGKDAPPERALPFEVLTLAAEVIVYQEQFVAAWNAGDMRTLEFAIGLFRRWKP